MALRKPEELDKIQVTVEIKVTRTPFISEGQTIGRGKAETTKNYESHRGIRLELVNLIDQVKGPIDEALEEGHRAHQLVVAEQQVAKAAEDAATN